MQRAIWMGLVLLFLAADWAALHDVLKGEADPQMEVLFLLLSTAVFLYLTFDTLRLRARRLGESPQTGLLVAAFIAVWVLGLSWAAAHDIRKGETDVVLEYAVLWTNFFAVAVGMLVVVDQRSHLLRSPQP